MQDNLRPNHLLMSEKIKVLYVEDELALANNMKRILEYDGFEVVHAENGADALTKLKDFRPDLVVCDIMMPEMDGYAFYDAFQLIGDKSVPFIFLTAVANPVDVRKAMNLGADDYLTKPVSRKDLVSTIKARLEKKSSLDGILKKAIAKYEAEITKRDVCLKEVAQNQSHVIRAPLATLMAVISVLNLETMEEENKTFAAMLAPLAEQLDKVIRENVYNINMTTIKEQKKT